MRFLAQAVLISAAIGALGVMPLEAQRGQFGGLRSGPPAAHGVQPLGGGHTFPVHTYGPPPLGLRPPAAGFTGIEPGALRSQPRYFEHGRGHNRVPQAAFITPYYYPFLGYSDSGYDAYPPYDTAQDPAAQTAAVTGNLLGQQIQDLSAQIEELRNEQEAARAQQPAPAAPQSNGPAEQMQAPQPPPIRLVLRSGQQVQVQNYAVVDGTFWDFTSQPTRRIPVANIDIPASQKATEDSGGEFPQLAGDR